MLEAVALPARGTAPLAEPAALRVSQVAVLEASLDNLRRVQTDRKWHDACWLDSMLRMVQSRLQAHPDPNPNPNANPYPDTETGTETNRNKTGVSAEGGKCRQQPRLAPAPPAPHRHPAHHLLSQESIDAKHAAPGPECDGAPSADASADPSYDRSSAPASAPAPSKPRLDETDSPPTSVETDASFEL